MNNNLFGQNSQGASQGQSLFGSGPFLNSGQVQGQGQGQSLFGSFGNNFNQNRSQNQNPSQSNLFGGLLSGGSLFGNSKQPILKELTEEEKAQYRFVDVLPETSYGQLLRQETKKNGMLRHLSLDNNSIKNLTRMPKDSSSRDSMKAIRRIYRVHRRKDIIKDSFSPAVSYRSGMANPGIARSLSFAVKYFTALEVKTEQNSDFKIMTNWLKIFHHTEFPKVKTLSLNMASWYILEENEGQFSIFRSLFPNVENLNISFTQMHGRKDIPIQEWTLNLVRRLQNLKSLRIEFVHCGFIKDEHLGIISKTLQSGLHSLESLELVLDGLNNDVTPTAITGLWKSLDKIPNLKKLELIGGFGINKINSEIFGTLCGVISRKSATLVALKIDVGYTEHVRCDSHERLCKVLVNILPRLRHLGFKFVSRDSVSDASMKYFGDLLSNGSNSLKSLHLEFGSHNYITSKGAKDLADGMKKGSFPMMEDLFIYFHMTYCLTYYDLLYIAEAIPEAFPNLKELRFSYSGSHAETDAELREKATMLLKERLKNLSEQFYIGW